MLLLLLLFAFDFLYSNFFPVNVCLTYSYYYYDYLRRQGAFYYNDSWQLNVIAIVKQYTTQIIQRMKIEKQTYICTCIVFEYFMVRFEVLRFPLR